MLEPQAALGLIFDVAKKIYVQVQLAKANRAQCERLVERIQVILEPVERLKTVKDKQAYKQGLNALSVCLNDCLIFVQKFSQNKQWFLELIKAGTHQERFQALTEGLRQALEQLNIGLNAQQLINHEQDKRDQLIDQAFIKERQEEIIKLNQEAIEAVQGLKKDHKEGQLILQEQVASLKAQLEVVIKHTQPHAKPPIDSEFLTPFYELRFDKALSEGSTGTVYTGRWLEQPVAIKLLEGQRTKQQQAEFIREVAIQSRLRSPRIVPFYAACLEPERACIVMEYNENHCLYDVLGQQLLTPSQQKQVALDIACGLHYLHYKGVLHRDLTSHSVLIDGQLRAKLADFGLAKGASASIRTAVQQSQSYEWLAPEVLLRAPYTTKADIYSYGVILWEIVTGQRPLADKTSAEMVKAITSHQREAIPSTVPKAYADLIQQCWAENPEDRPDSVNLIRRLEAIAVADLIARPSSPSAETYYEQGLKAEQYRDHKEAFRCYERSAAKGYFKAKTNVATFFLMGKEGVAPVNKARAYQFFLEAAQAGHARAMLSLAMMLEKGDGVKQDLVQALKWYEKALQGGMVAAEKKIPFLKQLLESEYPANTLQSYTR